MMPELFVVCAALLLAGMLRWAFRTLPQERWQILATLPRCKHGDGHWAGTNLTFYGVFNANAYTLATATVFMLLGAVAVPTGATLLLTAVLLGICMPASRIVARIVENKRYTFSVGGAAFLGVLAAPFIVLALRRWATPWVPADLPVMPVMAAVATAYALGEGIGRLACISFGCCYGKPMDQIHPILRRLFSRHAFIFTGSTKKIAYADGLEGKKIFPIQAVTATIYCTVALAGTYLFLKGYFRAAFLVPLLATQIWRFVSEFARADYRGGGRISAYQKMALVASGDGLIVGLAAGVPAGAAPDLSAGLAALWQPGMLLALQFLWIASFLYTGCSSVTGATLAFHVVKERV